MTKPYYLKRDKTGTKKNEFTHVNSISSIASRGNFPHGVALTILTNYGSQINY